MTDLLATKLKVILQRVETKDYQDVAEILRNGLSLKSGLARAEEMFGVAFSPIESTRALTYFNDPLLKDLADEDKICITDAVKKFYKKSQLK